MAFSMRVQRVLASKSCPQLSERANCTGRAIGQQARLVACRSGDRGRAGRNERPQQVRFADSYLRTPPLPALAFLQLCTTEGARVARHSYKLTINTLYSRATL